MTLFILLIQGSLFGNPCLKGRIESRINIQCVVVGIMGLKFDEEVMPGLFDEWW